MRFGWLRRAWRPLLVLAALQGLGILVYVGVKASRREKDPPLRYERVAGPSLPDVAVLQPDGTSTRLASLHGRPVLLHFWATWCPPCREELPGLLALPEVLGGNVEVVALTADEDWAAVREFFGAAIPSSVARDPEGRIVKTFGVSTLPDTYLIGADGRARLRFAGARDWQSAAALDTLRASTRKP